MYEDITGYKVITKIDRGVIETRLTDTKDRIIDGMVHTIIDTKDKQIIEALAKLGYIKRDWISVKDSLPVIPDGDDAVPVLVYFKSEVDKGYHIRSDYYWHDEDGFELKNVTHWMPLPDVPNHAAELPKS